MLDKYKFIRCLVYSIEIFIFFILQQTPELIPSMGKGSPILLIPVLVSIALFEDEKFGFWFGLYIGILSDIGFWKVIGFNAILFSVLGYFLGLLAVNLLKTNLLTAVIACAASIVVICSLQFIFTFLLMGFDSPFHAYLHLYIPNMLYTLIVSPILYFFNRAIALQIRER